MNPKEVQENITTAIIEALDKQNAKFLLAIHEEASSNRKATNDLVASHQKATNDLVASHQKATNDLVADHRRQIEEILLENLNLKEVIEDLKSELQEQANRIQELEIAISSENNDFDKLRSPLFPRSDKRFVYNSCRNEFLMFSKFRHYQF